MMTKNQLLSGSKTVTRRLGWKFLKPGDRVMACKQCQGLGKGGKIKRYGLIEIEQVWSERLGDITPTEILREGFPNMSVDEFVDYFIAGHKGCKRDTIITRIQFRKLF
tara:strand:- start:289 stop:612 length:324 start_codon:yes stop_codon:yes gene_type:complete